MRRVFVDGRGELEIGEGCGMSIVRYVWRNGCRGIETMLTDFDSEGDVLWGPRGVVRDVLLILLRCVWSSERIPSAINSC